MKQMRSKNLQKTQEKNSNINGFSEAKIGSTLSPLFTQTSNSNYNSDMEYTLSVVIIAADVLIFSLYCLIIHHATSSKKKASIKIKHKKLPIVCLAIGVTFVLLTLPFVIAKFFLGYIPSWANRSLIINSGMNSIVYFFSGKIKACRGKKNSKSIHITNWILYLDSRAISNNFTKT